MPKYVIERDIPGAGSVGPDEVRALSEKSNGVIADLGDVQWIHSDVTGDKLFCLYIAPQRGPRPRARDANRHSGKLRPRGRRDRRPDNRRRLRARGGDLSGAPERGGRVIAAPRAGRSDRIASCLLRGRRGERVAALPIVASTGGPPPSRHRISRCRSCADRAPLRAL
jgi:Protein of unknown function (DUF4242)